jgi:energy-coupling factor transport system substrate-specific component
MKLANVSPNVWPFLALCAALNVAVGFLVQALRLPIYLDSIGTILAAVIAGPILGALVGFIGLLVLSAITAPTALAYTGTAALVSFFAYVFYKWWYLRKWWATIVFGLLLGVIAAIASAPVTTYLFGGVSLAGADAVTAFFRATGQTLLKSVFLGGLATDPVDKVVTSIICHALILMLPSRLLESLRFRRPLP